MKEHLYRQHKLSQHYCHRCCSSFGTAELLREHQRAPQGCEIREQETTKGIITSGTGKVLKSKKRARKSQSEEEKWKDIYKIIFPDDLLIPSPYCEVETSGQFTRFQEFCEQNYDGLLRKRLKRAAEEDDVFQNEAHKRKILEALHEVHGEMFVQFEQAQDGGGELGENIHSPKCSSGSAEATPCPSPGIAQVQEADPTTDPPEAPPGQAAMTSEPDDSIQSSVALLETQSSANIAFPSTQLAVPVSSMPGQNQSPDHTGYSVHPAASSLTNQDSTDAANSDVRFDFISTDVLDSSSGNNDGSITWPSTTDFDNLFNSDGSGGSDLLTFDWPFPSAQN